MLPIPGRTTFDPAHTDLSKVLMNSLCFIGCTSYSARNWLEPAIYKKIPVKDYATGVAHESNLSLIDGIRSKRTVLNGRQLIATCRQVAGNESNLYEKALFIIRTLLGFDTNIP